MNVGLARGPFVTPIGMPTPLSAVFGRRHLDVVAVDGLVKPQGR